MSDPTSTLPTPEPTPQPPTPRSDRPATIIAILLVVSAVVMLYTSIFRRSDEPAPPPPRLELLQTPIPIGGPWELVDHAGEPINFSSFRGRPIFLNIWATWCPPCVAELPSIDALARDPRLKHVTFLCVSMDGRIELVADFIRSRKLSVPYYVASTEPPGNLLTDVIPATFIIDSDGRILVRELGSANWNDPAVIKFLETLQPAA